MANQKLIGNVNLAKLSRVAYTTIHGVKVIAIPVVENDIFIKTESVEGKTHLTHASLGIQIYESKEVGKFGDTHYIKRGLSKDFVQNNSKEAVESANSVFLGNLKPEPIKSSNEALNASEIPSADSALEVSPDDDLPF